MSQELLEDCYRKEPELLAERRLELKWPSIWKDTESDEPMTYTVRSSAMVPSERELVIASARSDLQPRIRHRDLAQKVSQRDFAAHRRRCPKH